MDPDKGLRLKLPDFSPEAVAESGQCFRMTGDGEGYYHLIAFRRVLGIKALGDGEFYFSSGPEEFNALWREYFDLDSDYGIYISVARSDDRYLREAIRFGSGIRILRQEPFETLISFIISQRKSIPAIRTSIERLARTLGEHLSDEDYAFPSPEAIAAASEEILRAAGLGYRLPYVREAAYAVAEGRLDFDELRFLPDDELIARLMSLKGVGLKVASCVALYAFHRLSVVPVDVWMKRVIDTVYDGGLPAEYADYAGVLHQYMFNYARLGKLGI